MEVAYSSHIILGPYISGWSRGNSVSIVSGYGLHDQAIEVRSPAEAKDFFPSLCPDRLWGPAFCTMDTRGAFPGSKARPGRDVDHSPSCSAEVVNE
jgi:hypothetical protein